MFWKDRNLYDLICSSLIYTIGQSWLAIRVDLYSQITQYENYPFKLTDTSYQLYTHLCHNTTTHITNDLFYTSMK